MRFFQPSEFDCRCGLCGLTGASMDNTFLQRLDVQRQLFGGAMTVTSGVRCPAHNKAEGGEDESYHLVRNGACAADIAIVGGVNRRKFVDIALGLGFSVGVKRDMIHLDDRFLKYNREPILFTY